MAGHNELNSNGQFHFISMQSPKDQGRTAKRLVRSHAVARGLENKRRRQQKSGHNFHPVSMKDVTVRSTSTSNQGQCRAEPLCALSTSTPGPLQMLAAESPRLQALSISLRSHQSGEPVFSVSDELVLQNLPSVLRKAQDDRALLSAVMLTLSFAATAGNIDRECLQYQGEALSYIRQSMSCPEKATTESTLGAILLLAGIEARIGMPHQVQLHMGAIKRILDTCRRKGVYLSDGIKRAIFWSDLNCSVMTGSSRVVDHTTFSELQWRRDPFTPNFFVLPPGFQDLSHSLGDSFVEVLKDVFALQCIRDSASLGKEDVMSMAHIDNHQASIQSRLVSLPNCCYISECCHLAAYLCSTMLRCKIWRASTVPVSGLRFPSSLSLLSGCTNFAFLKSHISLQLLLKLQQTNDEFVWDALPGLLAWLLYIGGAFAPTGTIRAGYVTLLHRNRSSRLRDLYTSWADLLEVLKKFIWSEKAFMSQVKAFWEETSSP